MFVCRHWVACNYLGGVIFHHVQDSCCALMMDQSKEKQLETKY